MSIASQDGMGIICKMPITFFAESPSDINLILSNVTVVYSSLLTDCYVVSQEVMNKVSQRLK